MGYPVTPEERMIQVDEKEQIRRAFFLEGKTIREIARERHHSRETVKEALTDSSPPEYSQGPRTYPTMGPYQETIDGWLLDDQKRPRKQRHTAHRIYERLREEHQFQGAESTVRRFVRLRKEILQIGRPDVFIPLEFGPGQDGQADFGEAEVIVAGERLVAQYLVVVLCYSTLPFVMAFPHQRQEAFFEGQVAGFEFFGGAPRRIWYDNLTQAVQRVLKGRNRREQQAFVSLRSRYLFESRFCTPGQGHEKGLVENQVGYVRRNFMVPIPEADTWAELNAQLLARCEREKEHRRRGEQQTIGERWAEEKPFLLPLPPTPFECCTYAPAQANQESLVPFDGNAYSVPTTYGHRRVLVKGFVHRVVITLQGDAIAEHPRCYGQGREILDPLHYLDLLHQRPGAFEHAKAIRRWRPTWPPVYEQYLAELILRLEEPEAVRRFVRVLKLHEDFPAEEIALALERALEVGCFHPDGVHNLLLVQHDPVPPQVLLDLSKRPGLAEFQVLPPDLQLYNRLLAQEK
jgi:transposase